MTTMMIEIADFSIEDSFHLNAIDSREYVDQFDDRISIVNDW